jgi:hypothetical protein
MAKYVKFEYRRKGDTNWIVVKTPEEKDFPHTYFKKFPDKSSKGLSELESLG